MNSRHHIILWPALGVLLGFLLFLSFSSNQPNSPFGEADPTGWTYQRAFSEAVSNGDPTICERINRDSIFGDIVSPPAEGVRENCKSEYAIEKGDISLCLSLSDERVPDYMSTRDGCLRFLAAKLHREDLCDLMPAVKDPNWGEIWLRDCKKSASK